MFDDHQQFLARSRRIPGWLENGAALRTMELLDWQELNGVTGPLFELGVFAGRYFSILLRSALRAGDRVVGLDNFLYTDETVVRRETAFVIEQGVDPVFVAKSSRDCEVQELLRLLGGPARFISLDGSHDYADVLHDLHMCDALLADRGVIAADDFLNPLTLGVNQAVNEYFAGRPGMVPFALLPNKLLLCRPAEADRYRLALEQFLIADPASAPSYHANRDNGRHHVEQPFHGSAVLLAF